MSSFTDAVRRGFLLALFCVFLSLSCPPLARILDPHASYGKNPIEHNASFIQHEKHLQQELRHAKDRVKQLNGTLINSQREVSQLRHALLAVKDELKKQQVLVGNQQKQNDAKNEVAAKDVSETRKEPQGFREFWCPGVGRRGDRHETCASSDRMWLFIWATGRSGSTTLLSMVNLLPAMYLTGENRMAKEALSLWDSWFMRAGRAPGKIKAWDHAPLEMEPFECALQDWFAAIPPTKKVRRDTPVIRGWKDVHFQPEHFRFLKEVFPCSRFIFNLRSNISEQVTSGHFKIAKTRPETLMAKSNQIRALHSELGPKRSYLINLEDYSRDSFERLYSWLGFDDCRVKGLIHDNNKGWTPDLNNRRKSLLEGSCTFLKHTAQSGQ